MSVSDNILRIRERIDRASGGRPVTLVGIAKTKSAGMVREAVAAGLTAVGENYVQELRDKQAQGAYAGAQLHLVGHLQKNKVKYVAGQVDLIQSVDSVALMEAISQRARALETVQDILLELNIGGEAGKTGAAAELLPALLEAAGRLPGLRVRGLMCIPPAGASGTYFNIMNKLFVDNRAKKYDNVSMDFLSMGMSEDFEQAIQAGANMVRVGSAIFGRRDYGAAGI